MAAGQPQATQPADETCNVFRLFHSVRSRNRSASEWATPPAREWYLSMDARMFDLRLIKLSIFILCPILSGHPEPTQEARLARKTRARTIPTQLVAFPRSPYENATLLENEIATPQMVAWLSHMIRENLPPTYEDSRKWNRQKEVWDGIEIWREGNRLETKRKKKLVNAGTWTRYEICFVDPNQNMHIEFHRLEPTADGKIAFSVTIDCALDISGRLSQWVRDVQLFSISANADAACRLTLDGTVAFQMNWLKLPPDIIIQPEVTFARVDLTHYKVRRVSQIGGEFASLLGQGLRRTVDDKLEETNAKLVSRINKQLTKQSDRLSFSTQDWLKSKLPLPASPE